MRTPREADFPVNFMDSVTKTTPRLGVVVATGVFLATGWWLWGESASLPAVGPGGEGVPDSLASSDSGATDGLEAPVAVGDASGSGRRVEGQGLRVVCLGLDGDGSKALEGVTVEPVVAEAAGQGSRGRAVLTDSSGVAILEAMDGAFGIKATAPGFCGAGAYLDASDWRGRVELTLTRLARLEVVVLGPEGASREGARVEVVYGDGLAQKAALVVAAEVPASSRLSKPTDAAGRVILERAIPGVPIVLEVRDDRYGAYRRRVDDLGPGEQRLENVTLENGGLATIRFVDAGLSPLTGARVTVFRKNGSTWTAIDWTSTGLSGEARIAGLRPGAHAITCIDWNLSASQLYLGELEFEIEPGAQVDLGVVEIARGPLDVSLSGEGISDGGRIALCSLFQVRDPSGSSVARRPNRIELPVGRPVRVWFDSPGTYSYSAALSGSQGLSPDMEFSAHRGEVGVPGVLEVDFVRIEREPIEPTLQFSFRKPRASDGREGRGFLVLLRGAEVVSAYPDVRADSPATLMVTSTLPGKHRLVGVLNGEALQLEALEPGQGAVSLDEVAGQAPAQFRVRLEDRDGAALPPGDVEILVGENELTPVLRLSASDGVVEFEFPPGLACWIRVGYRGSYRRGFLEAASASGRVERDLRLGPVR